MGRDMLPAVGRPGVMARAYVVLPGFPAHPGGGAAVVGWPPGEACWRAVPGGDGRERDGARGNGGGGFPPVGGWPAEHVCAGPGGGRRRAAAGGHGWCSWRGAGGELAFGVPGP